MPKSPVTLYHQGERTAEAVAARNSYMKYYMREYRMTDQLPERVARWTPRRKARVINAVRKGLIGLADALARYDLSEDEYRAWERDYDARGVEGLRVSAGRYLRMRLAVVLLLASAACSHDARAATFHVTECRYDGEVWSPRVDALGETCWMRDRPSNAGWRFWLSVLHVLTESDEGSYLFLKPAD